MDTLDKLIAFTKDNMRLKGLYERATYLCVLLKNYPKAVAYQTRLVAICEALYLRKNSLPHPLLAFHYYQLGKLQSQLDDYQLSTETLKKASLLFASYYGLKSTIDGKMINERLVHQCNENYLANL